MGTLTPDVAASNRLSRQFEAALARSPGRDARLQGRHFVRCLCDRLERNNRALMASGSFRPHGSAWQGARAARQGESVMMTCMFLLNDLAGRIGRQRVAEDLLSTRTRAGRALARRVGARSKDGVEITRFRFSTGDSSFRARQVSAVHAPYAGTGAMSGTWCFDGHYPGRLCLGVVVENFGERSHHFVAAHVRLLARFSGDEPWVETAGNAFAFLEKVSPSEGQVLALRSFDIMELLRGSDRFNRDPLAVQVLSRIV